MAQTSTRKKSSPTGGRRRRSSGSTPASASSRGSSSNRQPRKRSAANSRKSGASRRGHSRVSAVSGKRSAANSSSGGAADAVKQIASKGKDAVAEGTHSSGKVISSAADKAKWPAVAGGAALAGLAGGLALGAKRNSGGKVLGMRLGNGRGKAGKNLAEAGKNVGRFSENIGQFAAEVRKTREAIENGSKHSSPIEVVLRALTTRR